MASRMSMDHNTDKAVFTRTAIAGKKINFSPRPMRGGIRF